MSLPVTTFPPLRERLLVVDAQPGALDALEAALAPLGGEVLRATSGSEALALLEHQRVAAILMNVSLPELDGFETAVRLRAQATTRTIPVLFLTGEHGIERQLRGYAVGAVDCLPKSVDPEVLRAKVRSIVCWAAELRALARAHDAAGSPAGGATALSWRRDRSASAAAPNLTLLEGGKRRDDSFVDLHRLLELHLDASLEAPAAARAALRQVLHNAPERTAQVAVLLVSELVTNAVLHAHSSAVVRCDLGPQVLRVEVQDCATHAPTPSPTTDGHGRGRGLAMVRDLADRSGWTRYPRGKVVWFELDLRAQR